MKMHWMQISGVDRYAAKRRAKELGLSLSGYIRSLVEKDLDAGPSGEPVSRQPECSRCDSTGWVCEAHPERPWDGKGACGCGAPGDPCPECNELAGETPRQPAGMRIDIAKDGWRH